MLAQTTRTVCQRTASKTRPKEIGREARKGIDRLGVFVRKNEIRPPQARISDTTRRAKRWSATSVTTEKSPTQSFSSAKYKSHIRTHTQHGRATRHGRHCGALTDCLDASPRHTLVPSVPSSRSPIFPPSLDPPPSTPTREQTS